MQYIPPSLAIGANLLISCIIITMLMILIVLEYYCLRYRAYGGLFIVVLPDMHWFYGSC